jgi:hypothetical protein
LKKRHLFPYHLLPVRRIKQKRTLVSNWAHTIPAGSFTNPFPLTFSREACIIIADGVKRYKKSLMLLLFFLICATHRIQAGGELQCNSSRSGAMGGVSVVLIDIWSAGGNPAAIPFLDGIAAGICGQNLYLIKSLNTALLAMTLSSHAGGFGLAVCHSGMTGYNELKADLGYGRKFGKQFSAGVSLTYYYLHASGEYRTRHLASFEAGILYRPGSHWSFGVHCLNPFPVKVSTFPEEYLPWMIKAGLSYLFKEGLLMVAEIGKQPGIPVNILAGIEYHLVAPFCLRIGISSQPVRLTFGAGFEWKKLTIDIASGYHLQLGFNPSISFSYHF